MHGRNNNVKFTATKFFKDVLKSYSERPLVIFL